MIDWPAKAPSEVADYAFDWSSALTDGETIATRSVVAEGVTKDSDVIVGTLVRVWLLGGTDGAVATVRCTITTSGGRTFDEVAVLPIGRTAISLADAKRALRIEHDSDDELIGSFLASAVGHVERVTGKVLAPKIVSQVAAGFPDRGAIRLYRAPVREVVAIAYDDGDGVEQELTDYRLSEGEPASVTALFGTSFPVAYSAPASVRIRYLAGYAPGEMPPELKSAVILKLRQLYDGPDGREDAHGEPRGFESLIRPYCGVGIG